MKIVINNDYGGWSVSESFLQYYDIPYTKEWGRCFPKENISNKDPRLIEYIEKFGTKMASGKFAHLTIVDIPDGTAYRICEYDGSEYIEYRDEIEWEIAKD